MLALLPLTAAPYGWSFSDEENTATDPWTPCERSVGVAETGGAEVVRGFCRLSCTARWSYAPERMDCKMLPLEDLLARSHSRGLERFRQMSQESFSEVNSGISAFGSNAPEE